MKPENMRIVEMAQKSEQIPVSTNDDQSAMLFDLRSKWLADFEAAALLPAPKPPTPTEKLRNTIKAIAKGFGSRLERSGGVVPVAASRDEEMPQEAFGELTCVESLESSVGVLQREPIAPAGPLAPPVSEEVLELRSGWLADIEASPEKHAPKPVSWSAKLRREIQPITDEISYWFHCLKDFAVRTKTPRATRRHTIRGERARRAEAAGRFISVTFVLALCVGTVVYVAAVVHIFDPRHLARILGQ